MDYNWNGAAALQPSKINCLEVDQSFDLVDFINADNTRYLPEKESDIDLHSLHNCQHSTDSEKGLDLIENNSDPDSPTFSTTSSLDLGLLDSILQSNQIMTEGEQSIANVNRAVQQPSPGVGFGRNEVSGINEELVNPNFHFFHNDNKIQHEGEGYSMTNSVTTIAGDAFVYPSVTLPYQTASTDALNSPFYNSCSTESVQTVKSRGCSSSETDSPNFMKSGSSDQRRSRTPRQERNNEASRKLREKRKRQKDEIQQQEEDAKRLNQELRTEVQKLETQVNETYSSVQLLLAHFAQDNTEKLKQHHRMVLRLRADTNNVEMKRICDQVLTRCFKPVNRFPESSDEQSEIVLLDKTSPPDSKKSDSKKSGFNRKRQHTNSEQSEEQPSAKQQKQQLESESQNQIIIIDNDALLEQTINTAAQTMDVFKECLETFSILRAQSTDPEQKRFCQHFLLCLQRAIERMTENKQNKIIDWLHQQC